MEVGLGLGLGVEVGIGSMVGLGVKVGVGVGIGVEVGIGSMVAEYVADREDDEARAVCRFGPVRPITCEAD